MNYCPIEEEEELGNRTHVKIYSIDKNLTKEDSEFTKHVPKEEYQQTHNSSSWVFDEHQDNDAFFVDLRNNPERFSGFNGSDVWRELYVSNLGNLKFNKTGAHERFLYRIISGIQVNVNMHIAHSYLYELEAHEASLEDFEPNYDIFYERVGKHPDRIENLFYAYTFLLHSIHDLGDILSKYTYDTESSSKNEVLRNKMKWMVHYTNALEGLSEIENDLYTNISKDELVSAIKPVYKNITGLLDWISCNICKLNAKVQFNGAAAMFKVLFEDHNTIHITENELSGYINLIYRLSNSVKWYKEWLEYEDKQAFFKTMILCISLAVIGIIVFISLILLFYKAPESEETKPLTKPDDIKSA